MAIHLEVLEPSPRRRPIALNVPKGKITVEYQLHYFDKLEDFFCNVQQLYIKLCDSLQYAYYI